MPFSVASARSVASIRIVLAGVPLALPVVELNGALISDLRTGRHEVVNAIEPEVAEDVYRLFLQRGHVPCIATFDGKVDCLYHPAATNEGMHWYVRDVEGQLDRHVRCPIDLADALSERVICMTVIARAEPLAELELLLRERTAR
ncbi:MAG TPA: HAD hydrolase family protein [Gammaproteobacteria bacterium]